ncbi:MAG: dTDP-4-dehydrorhamnose 3,5-epimerase [Candidatus Shapirobacteria bacterium]|jgi:dTDP-4-dehydrorhamnose 3,5-epimerase
MNFIPTPLDGLFLIEPKVFSDERGYFLESYNQKEFNQNGIDVNFVQDNHSYSQKNILRGLHFQNPPFAQAKLIRVVTGEVFDVAVDIRPDSPTFGQYYSVNLSSENHLMLYVPAGFAHGFCVLSETVNFLYKCSDFYHQEAEGGIIYNDPSLQIPWPVSDPILSAKDQAWPSYKFS